LPRSPQSFEKRQRERRKQQKRLEKQERRHERNAEKKIAKENGETPDRNWLEPGYSEPEEPGEAPDPN
jgi:hypothetical protein